MMNASGEEWRPRHILVTGGAGFIGSNFVHWVLREQSDVYITVLDALTYAGSLVALTSLDEPSLCLSLESLASCAGPTAGSTVGSTVGSAAGLSVGSAAGSAVGSTVGSIASPTVASTQPSLWTSQDFGAKCSRSCASCDFVTERLCFVHGDICDAQLLDQLLSHTYLDCLLPNSLLDSDDDADTTTIGVKSNFAVARSMKISKNDIPPIDAIVHFAAESHNDNSIADPMPFIRTNVQGTATLLEAARKHGNIRFHHISTDEVYGDLPLESTARFSESSPYRPSSPYSSSKAASDHLVRAWYRTYGLPVTISNCSNNFGPWQHIEKFIPRQITNILTGRSAKLYGTGDAIRDWIDVEDHCSAIWTVLTRGHMGETYLIGADGERSNLAVLQEILRCMGYREDDFEYVDDRPGADRRYAIDADKIQRELGWYPRYTDFSRQLHQVIAWYRRHKNWWITSKQCTEDKYQRQGH